MGCLSSKEENTGQRAHFSEEMESHSHNPNPQSKAKPKATKELDTDTDGDMDTENEAESNAHNINNAHSNARGAQTQTSNTHSNRNQNQNGKGNAHMNNAKSMNKGDKEINKYLKEKKKSRQRDREINIKLLLLGAGESGKSTLLRQMRYHYGEPFSAQELIDYLPNLWKNVIEVMRTLAIQTTLLSEQYNLTECQIQGTTHIIDKYKAHIAKKQQKSAQSTDAKTDTNTNTDTNAQNTENTQNSQNDTKGDSEMGSKSNSKGDTKDDKTQEKTEDKTEDKTADNTEEKKEDSGDTGNAGPLTVSFANIEATMSEKEELERAESREERMVRFKKSKEIKNIRDYVATLNNKMVFTRDIYKKFKLLLNDDGIQNTLQHTSKYQMIDTYQYLISHMSLYVSDNDYIPTFDDILHMRKRTTGVNKISFVIDGKNNKNKAKNKNNNDKVLDVSKDVPGMQGMTGMGGMGEERDTSLVHSNIKETYVVFDVGGQQNERRKWVRLFDNVSAIIYMVALSGFNQQLWEDSRVNRLKEAMALFRQIINVKTFKECSAILFLNKSDLFAVKVKKYNIKDYFSDYRGKPYSYTDGINYIKYKFGQQAINKNKKIYAHVTCATNREHIKLMFVSVREILIRQELKASGFV